VAARCGTQNMSGSDGDALWVNCLFFEKSLMGMFTGIETKPGLPANQAIIGSQVPFKHKTFLIHIFNTIDHWLLLESIEIPDRKCSSLEGIGVIILKKLQQKNLQGRIFLKGPYGFILERPAFIYFALLSCVFSSANDRGGIDLCVFGNFFLSS
jgi:hypothetical protein